MANYAVGFEQVELVNGLGEDKPVWLYLRGTLYNENDLETPLWVSEVGSLPPDPNRNVFPSFPRGGAGRFADHLKRDVAVRNHSNMGVPNFQLDPIDVKPGQMLEVMVMMLPMVWLERKRVPVDDLDRLTIGYFGSMLGNFFGGVIGSIVGGLFGGLVLGGGSQEVEVPCFNSVILARHLFTAADLANMQSQGSVRFGPRDNEASVVCEAIDSYYWLSANNHGYSFGPMPQIDKEDCRLEPRVTNSAKNQLEGIWADVGDNATDRVWVNIAFVSERRVNVSIIEKRNGQSETLTFEDVPVTLGQPENIFLRNFIDDSTYVPRLPTPTCPYCRRFKTPLAFIEIEQELLWAGMLAGSHYGTRPLFSLKINTDQVNTPRPPLPGDPCEDHQARSSRLALEAQETYEAPGKLNETLFAKNIEDGLVHLWPTGTFPMRKVITERFDIDQLDFDIIPAIVAGSAISWLIVCSPQIYLASYGEVQANGEVCATRVRYVHKTEDGHTLFDVMLRVPKPIIR